MTYSLIGDSHAVNLQKPLAALLGPAVQVSAIVGANTGAFVGKSFPGDLVIVVLGTNDEKALSPQQSSINANAIEQAQNGQVLWIGPPSYSFDRGTADAIAGAVTNFYDSRALPLSNYFQGDGIHLTAAGYQLWANNIAAVAQNLIANAPQQLVVDDSTGAVAPLDPSIGGGQPSALPWLIGLAVLALILRRLF